MIKPKLIRDKIPKIIEQNGGTPVIHIASNEEYWEKLKEKLSEELNEFLEDENIEELADVLEVIRAISKHKNINFEELEKIRKDKAEQRGSFDKKIILDNIE